MSSDLVEYRVSQALASSDALQIAAQSESGIVELLSMAAGEEDQDNRWHRYEELKRAGAQYVGWQAMQEKLRSPAMYQAFVEAIDDLLPNLEETA